MASHVLLTGTPGCGKTTLIRCIIEQLDDLRLAGFYTQELRGQGGPLPVMDQRGRTHPVCDAFYEAGGQAGHRRSATSSGKSSVPSDSSARRAHRRPPANSRRRFSTAFFTTFL